MELEREGEAVQVQSSKANFDINTVHSPPSCPPMDTLPLVVCSMYLSMKVISECHLVMANDSQL